MQYALSVPKGTKFDFQNIDVKLYLALKGIIGHAENESEALYNLAKQAPAEDSDQIRLEAERAGNRVEAAQLALAEFELSPGPLPEWAFGRNWSYDLQPGAQLCTKDGRRMGNAHVLRQHWEGNPEFDGNARMLYDCITDAGSYIHSMTENELTEAFYIGEWISDPKTLIARFGNHGEDYGLPQQGDPDV